MFFFNLARNINMKQTLITRLILGAFAGLAAVGAYAGQIQSSSTQIAREVITTDTQTLTAPSIAYRFFGDIDATSQDQVFQVQFTLDKGTWATAPAAPAVSITDIGANVIDQAAATYTVDTIGLSSDSKTVYATITVKLGTPLIKQPLIAINTSSNTIGGVALTNTAASRGTVTGLYTVVGDLVNDFNASGICSANKTIGVSFKHYTALTAPASLATDSNANPDEHNRTSSTNTQNGWLVFPTNVKVNLGAPSNTNAKIAGGNVSFSQTDAVAYASGNEYINGTLAMLGSLYLSQNANGYDGDLTHNYVIAGVGGGADATGLDHIVTAAANVGDVETNVATVAVTGSNGFVTGGTLFLSVGGGANDCATAIGGTATASTTGYSAANSTITLTIPNASINAAFGAAGTNNIYVCYTVPGSSTIPSSSFTAVGRLVKADPGVNLDEQDNICNGTLASLGGSIKIDVRNYASAAETSGWQSVIRVINPSDLVAADVWAQLINQDGTLGNFAKLTDLPVRGIRNFTAAQIDAALAAGSAATASPGTAAAVSSQTSATTGAPRLRITSTTGNTLRVQNYLYNTSTGQIVEGSGSEAVDFAGTSDRAPANEGQYQAQDAQSGLNLQ